MLALQLTLNEPLTEEEYEVLDLFSQALLGPTHDGATKRAAGEKVHWKMDTTHEEHFWNHMDPMRPMYDEDSGYNKKVHAAWRLLAMALQEGVTQEARDQRKGGKSIAREGDVTSV